MKIGVAVDGIATRLAALRQERSRERAIRTALDALAEQARQRDPATGADTRTPAVAATDEVIPRS